MKLQEAIESNTERKGIARQKWIDAGSKMMLGISSKKLEELNITLSSDSLEADDWIFVDYKICQACKNYIIS